jgi:hypothetical protein
MRRLPSVAAFVLAVVGAVPLTAQQTAPRVPPPRTDDSPFRRFELPPPSAVRTASGAPGRDYWQQRADYVIKAELDTLARAVTGDEIITYTNNSPDTLRHIWLHVEQNLFNSQSRGARLFEQDSRWGTGGSEGGFRLTFVGTPPVLGPRGTRTLKEAQRLDYVVNGTLMKVVLAQPLPPKAKTQLSIGWSFPFEKISNRMGIETIDGSQVYEVAQWYPRVVVYDDVRGWNTDQYYGQGEFYLEYGRFDVSITLPANMLVGATGVLQNPLEVLTARERDRLAQARTAAAPVYIRAPEEVRDPTSRPAGRDGRLTWRFVADSVRDFAWAAASHFVWNAIGADGGKVLSQAFYPPSADSIWKAAPEYGRIAIERYSQQWFPYPYPVATNINGIEGGMEYPMIVFCRNRTSAEGLYGVTDHEFGHTWFPMVVGSNEKRYAWMDEGFNTFINHYNQKARYPDTPPERRRGSVQSYIPFALSGNEQPAWTPADRVDPRSLGQVAYNKPAVGLVLLREQIVGPERFDPVFREYIRRWAFRHPTPADFFRTMEDGLGEDLSWFWRSWFTTTETMDIAVDSVTVSDTAGVESRIFLRAIGPMVMPVVAELLLSDGTTERLRLPVEIWFRGSRYVAAVPGKKVTSVRLDPDQVFPDVNRTNDRWPVPVGIP